MEERRDCPHFHYVACSAERRDQHHSLMCSGELGADSQDEQYDQSVILVITGDGAGEEVPNRQTRDRGLNRQSGWRCRMRELSGIDPWSKGAPTKLCQVPITTPPSTEITAP